MKVLEKRIKRNVNKQMKFIEGNIDYFTNDHLIIIEDTINRINEIEKSIEILYCQGIIDTQCYTTLFDYLNAMVIVLYSYKSKIKNRKKL